MERIRLYSMFLACLVLAACAGEDPASDPATPATAVEVAPPSPAMARPGEMLLPDGNRLPGTAFVRKAQSWSDRLATLSHAERLRLESLNTRYFGTLEFASPEEQEALVDAGFPMPEEWLAADAMSDAELERLAKARSPKGSLFYANRELDRYLEARERLGDNRRDTDASVMHPKVEAMVYASEALALTRSPFAAYLYGSINAHLFQDPSYTAAALAVGWSLGDQRGRFLTRQFADTMQRREDQKLDLGTVAAAEHLMWRHVHRYRPL